MLKQGIPFFSTARTQTQIWQDVRGESLIGVFVALAFFLIVLVNSLNGMTNYFRQSIFLKNRGTLEATMNEGLARISSVITTAGGLPTFLRNLTGNPSSYNPVLD